MATVSDISNVPFSGLNHIDALLDSGPDWNYFTGTPNTLAYTFSVASGIENSQTGQQAFSALQQTAVRNALAYISTLTGIKFVETAVGTDAQIHLANVDLAGGNVTGLCSWQGNYSYLGTELKTYDADAYVYLDNAEWNFQNSNLTSGGSGYETLLHELGHALGLKHPFETIPENANVLPTSQDNTSNTLMSYTDLGGPYSTYNQDDIAALNWLYGRDGLGGALGINSTSGARYITGTSGADTIIGTEADDTIEGDGGNDVLTGGNGNDTANFRGLQADYTFLNLANGSLQVTHKAGGVTSDGTDTLSSIEVLKFADGSILRASLLDTTAPGAPSLAVTKNANGYVTTDKPVVTGSTEANATVKIYTSADVLVGSGRADANGGFSVTLNHFDDGRNYQIYAVASDAAGNTSVKSGAVTFDLDAVTHAPGSILATFYDAGSVDSSIQLVHALIAIAQGTTGQGGTAAHAQASSLAGDIPDIQAQLVGVAQHDIAHASLIAA